MRSVQAFEVVLKDHKLSSLEMMPRIFLKIKIECKLSGFIFSISRPRGVNYLKHQNMLKKKKSTLNIFRLTVCQFLNICHFLCQLTKWPPCCNVYKGICLECRVAKPGIRISLFHSSSYVLRSRLHGNLTVSWHLKPTVQTAFDVTRNNSESNPRTWKNVSALIFPLLVVFNSCLRSVTVTSATLSRSQEKPARHHHTARCVVSRRLLDSSSPCSVETVKGEKMAWEGGRVGWMDVWLWSHHAWTGGLGQVAPSLVSPQGAIDWWPCVCGR